MRLVRGRGLLVCTFLFPSAALACGMCTDTMVAQFSWWTGAGFWIVGAFLAQTAVTALWRWRKRAPIGEPPAFLSIAVGALFMALSAMGSGFTVGFGILAAYCLALLARSVWKSRANPTERILIRFRLGVALLAFAFFAVRARPSEIPTEKLVRTLTYGGFPRDYANLATRSWMVGELIGRPGALEYLDRQLATRALQEADAQLQKLVALQYLANGAYEARRAACALLLKDPQNSGPVPSLDEVCRSPVATD